MQGFNTLHRFFKKARLDVEYHNEIPSGSTSHNEERVYVASALIAESDFIGFQPSEDIEIPSIISEIDCQPNENIEVAVNLPVQIEANSPAKCHGHKLDISDVHSKLACHLLSSMNIVMENKTLHHDTCAINEYKLFPGNFVANKICTDLLYSVKLKELVERGKKSYNKDLIRMNHSYLSHSQLSEKAKALYEEKREMRLYLMNSLFKNSKLCTTLSMHERFLVSISENNLPRLQQLVNVALKNHSSISHIVTKVTSVIDGIYMPNPSQNDKDLAFLVLKFGGPSLLSILHCAGVLPSVSLAYKMSKQFKPLISSVKKSVSECFDANILISDLGKGLVSLKMDETYITPVLSYNQRDNQAYGTCYQHGCKSKLELDTFQDCINMQQSINNGDLHIPKECLVVGISSLNENKPLQPLLMWPTCAKNDKDGTIQLISEVNNKMKENYSFPLMNFCTDGDGTRRKVANILMQFKVDHTYPWFSHIGNLPLVDNVAGPDGITVNFDPKHMVKRCWFMLLREKMVINGIALTKTLLKELFVGNTYGVGENALYPKDKQNVKSATSFLLAFIESTQKTEVTYNLVPIKSDLMLLGEVFLGLLSFYVFTDKSISEQIKSFSTAAYLLYYLYGQHKTSLMPSQLYHDIQMSFIDAVFCCAKAKEYCPNEPFYLLLDGTDLAERLFGNIRLHFKGSNYNNLEMINCARSMATCDKMLMVNHPDWVIKSRVQSRLALDYSNPSSWNRDRLLLETVNIRATWKSGYHRALSMIPYDDANTIESATTTLRCPIKHGVIVGAAGVENFVADWSVSDDGIDDVEHNDNEMSETMEEGDLNLSEIIQDPSQSIKPFFLIDESKVYKTTCLKTITSKQNLSKDRLRRVQGLSTYPGEKSTNCNVDAFLLNGDPVLVNHNGGPMIANVFDIIKSNLILKQIDITQDTEQMKNIELSLKVIDTILVDGKLYWKGSTSGELFKCVGENYLPIKPSINLNPPEGLTKYYFDMNQIRDMGVHLQLSNTETNQQPKSSAESIVQKKCFKCKKVVPLSDMRCHIGTHILRNELDGPNICGFCGRDTCSIIMKKTSKKGAKQFFGIESCDCDYYFDYGRSKKINKKTNPCTNHIERCPMKGCFSNVWIYNYAIHFDEKHNGEMFPAEMVIAEEEKKLLK